MFSIYSWREHWLTIIFFEMHIICPFWLAILHPKLTRGYNHHRHKKWCTLWGHFEVLDLTRLWSAFWDHCVCAVLNSVQKLQLITKALQNNQCLASEYSSSSTITVVSSDSAPDFNNSVYIHVYTYDAYHASNYL